MKHNLNMGFPLNRAIYFMGIVGRFGLICLPVFTIEHKMRWDRQSMGWLIGLQIWDRIIAGIWWRFIFFAEAGKHDSRDTKITKIK